jgi:two-component system NtrC family sensor kinase
VPRLGLGARLAVAMVGSLTVLLTLLGVLYVRQYQASEERLIRLSEDRMGDLIRRSTRSAMLRNDRQELAVMLPEIGQLPQLQRLRIYDKTGTIRYSSAAGEIGTRVDMTADACDRCHASAQPLRHLDRSDRARVYRQGGQRIMGMIIPIPNELDCVNAACHVHPADRAVLGVLDVQMSLRSVDEEMAGWIRSFLMSSLFVLLVVSVLAVLIAWRTIRRPVRNLVQATRAISAGNLEQRVPDPFDIDLTELVHSFNQMTADLAAARRESEQWARSLEQRVQEKTVALRRAQDEMVQVEKMASLGKLAAIVAHEINNPLAGIRTYAKLLLRKMGRMAPETVGAGQEAEEVAVAPAALPDGARHEASMLFSIEAREWLSRIESEAARCGEIVRNLLSFSRTSEPQIHPVDLNEVICQSVRLVRHRFDLGSIEIDLQLALDLPPIECDPQQVKQALLAILINAAEAMSQGGQVSIVSRMRGEEGAEILIRDTGIGMDEETRKHVFEPFFTTKDAAASGGTGLGLSVVYRIVRSHGGSVSVESKPGRGSVFTLYLPRIHPSHSEGEPE